MTKGPPKMMQTNFAPPWREVMPTGKLGPEYGPASAAAYARQIARFKDWSWRTPSKVARRDADEVIGWMRQVGTPGEGELRAEVPTSEREAYLLIFEQGHSVRYVARLRGITRESVKSYLRRLKARIGGAS